MGRWLVAGCVAIAVLPACTGSDMPAGGTTAAPAAETRAATTQPPGGSTRAAEPQPSPADDVARRRLVLGRSARGRPIRALVLRTGAGRLRFLVVGCIHGDECAGSAIARRLEQSPLIPGLDLWLLASLNPDGRALGVRQNGRGVDLNRNFPSEWRPIGRRWDPEYSGPRPLSEPETLIARRLVLRTRPRVTIWYHQYWGAEPFVRAWGGSIPAGRRYARLAGIEFRPLPWPAGTAPNWQNHRFPGASSFVVEFPRGPLDPETVRTQARAVLALARETSGAAARP